MTEIEKVGDIFSPTEIGSLFEPVKPEELEKVATPSDSLFEEEEKKEEEKPSILDAPPSTLFEDDEPLSEEEQSAVTGNSFGKAIQTILKHNEDFQIYEGDDPENLEYSEEQFADLFNQNVQLKGEKIAEAVLEEALSRLSPTMQKLVTGELQGIKIADIVKDLEDYQEIESIPENPSPEQKEKIVRKYYQRQAKDRNKDQEWVNKQIEKIIDRDELDSEFEDARDIISQDLDKKQKEKEQEIIKQKQEKEQFKRYHTHYVSEALKEENIFGLKLSKPEKDQVATVLSSFAVRPTDNKEKLGLTALIDSYINSDNPKETYKRLVLMTLAATAPDKLIQKLSIESEKKVTRETTRQLKTVSKEVTALEGTKKQTIKKPGNIF